MYDMTNLQVSHLYRSEVVHVKLSQLVSVNYTCISLPLKIIAAVDSGRANWPQENREGQRQWHWLKSRLTTVN